MKPDGEILRRYVQGQKLLFLAEQCLNLTRKALDPILRSHRLNHSQYLILMILNYGEATGQQVISTELSYLLGREKHTITPLVEGLVKNGLLQRGQDPQDRRVITLKLTRKGKALIRTVQPLTMQTLADIPLGSEKETKSMLRILETFRKAFAEKSGLDPDLYSGTFARLLVAGENKLLEDASGAHREGG